MSGTLCVSPRDSLVGEPKQRVNLTEDGVLVSLPQDIQHVKLVFLCLCLCEDDRKCTASGKRLFRQEFSWSPGREEDDP